MSTIVPPLNVVPELPAKAITKLIEILNKQLEKLTVDMQKMIADSIKIPEGCDCNDPRIQSLKDQLAKIQKRIDDIQKLLGNLNKIISTLSKLIKLAKAVKLAVSAAVLLNPLTAPAFIASQLTLIQDATIVNAINSLKLLKQIPNTINGQLASLLGPVMDAISKISATCGGNDDGKLRVSKDVANAMSDNSGAADYLNKQGIDIDANGLGDDFDYNDLLDTEFYRDVNVSDIDLDGRAEAIKRMVEQQQDLLTSIIEAPSQVFSGIGAPAAQLGKPGDYYVDTSTNDIYGPKMSRDSWE
jgi:hypothetical protein